MSISSLVSPTHALKMGDAGPAVAAAQLAMKKMGYALKGSSWFGPATKVAVQAIQRKAGLVADGEIGPDTAKVIDAATLVQPINKPPPPPSPSLGDLERPLWLEAGIALIGTKEFAGGRDNPAIIQWAKDEGGDISTEYTHDSIPWCALFQNHLLTKVGLEGTETLWALDFNSDAMKRRIGRGWPAVKLIGPAVGAFAPMTRNGGGHVTNVAGVDQHGNIMGLGGNQSDAVNIVPFANSRFNQGFWWPKGAPMPKNVGLKSLPIVRSDGRLSTKEA